MEREEIERKLRQIIREQLDVPEKEVRLDASFVDDLKADDLALVELKIAAEAEFGIEIPDEDWVNSPGAGGQIDFDGRFTVGRAIDYLAKRLA